MQGHHIQPLWFSVTPLQTLLLLEKIYLYYLYSVFFDVSIENVGSSYH